jgi:hypothetical protein
MQDNCEHKIKAQPIERRPVNGLNIEPIEPQPRCRLKTPEHWNDRDPLAARWLCSGGSPLVLGWCSGNCPLKKQ